MKNDVITIKPKYSKDVFIIDREYIRRIEEERRNRPADYYDTIDAIYDTPDIDLEYWPDEDDFE